MEQRDTRPLWQGLLTITDYRGSTPSTVSGVASLADYLNSFYARFDTSHNTASGTIAEVSFIARDEHTLSVTKHDVKRALMRVNTRKVAGPDGVSRRVSKTHANQLAPVFTTIFNLSLAESAVPACFKWSTIFRAQDSLSSRPE